MANPAAFRVLPWIRQICECHLSHVIIHSAHPDPLCQPDKSFVSFQFPPPSCRNSFKSPVRTGKGTGAGADRIRIAAKVDRGESSLFKRPGIHETAEGCLRAEYAIQGRIRIILIITAQDCVHLRIYTKRTGVPECGPPWNPPHHLAHHQVQECRTVPSHRIVMRYGGAADAH